jgi:hypothetical protein
VADQNKKNVPKHKKARDESDENDIFAAPVITREPQSRQVKLGSKIVLRITATARPLPSFQWFHNGKKISGANSDRLTLNKIRRLSGGAYHCEVKNFAGKVVSRACMVSFFTQKIPQIVIEPRESRLEEGRPFVLRVISPSKDELKDFKIYWTFNGMRIKSARGLELTISEAKKKYEGEYKAIISTGSGIETSNVAKLKVVAAAAVASEAEPEVAPQLAVNASTVKTTVEAPWEDFVFTPDSDETEPQEEFLSQLGTRELVRELEHLEENESAVPEPAKKKRPNPKLLRKKEFLEKFLTRWQRHLARKQVA